MGGARKNTKKLPYQVLGKWQVSAELRSGRPPARRELTDEDRWHLAQDANPAALRLRESEEPPEERVIVRPLSRRHVLK